MMAQSRAESTRDTYNYGQYLNQFPPYTIKVIREFERIQKRICRHKMSIMFNEICINEEMLPKYTYIYIYIYVCVCVCVCMYVYIYMYIYIYIYKIGSLTEKPFTKLKLFSLVLSLLSDHIQGNSVEKDFQIFIKLNFINIHTIVRGKGWTKI